MKPNLIAIIGAACLMVVVAIADTGQEQSSTLVRLLQEQVEKLAAENELLRKENQALRQQIGARPKDATQTSTDISSLQATDNKTKNADAAIEYWLSSTGKRHNSRCRYFKTGKGRPCGKADGTPCKVCGG